MIKNYANTVRYCIAQVEPATYLGTGPRSARASCTGHLSFIARTRDARGGGRRAAYAARGHLASERRIARVSDTQIGFNSH